MSLSGGTVLWCVIGAFPESPKTTVCYSWLSVQVPVFSTQLKVTAAWIHLPSQEPLHCLCVWRLLYFIAIVQFLDLNRYFQCF